ncbi:MAG: metallophosphoesterase [Clostridia bacterium]|nr:metallophosphoesterase [Clostridia bacterium]
MRKLLSVILALVLTAAFLPATQAQTQPLTFRADGTFRILQLSDPQDDAYPAWDMLNLIRTAVKFADPDLIVLSGDLVEDTRGGDVGIDAQPVLEGVVVRTPDMQMDLAKTRENVEKAVDAILGELETFGIPYVFALGNNDRKVGLTGEDWIEILSAYEHCIIFDESPDAADGVDYHVTVRGASGEPAFNVWLMDSGLSGITDEQVDWYRSASAEMTAANGGAPVPALWFQHIQCADIGNLFEPCKAIDEGAKKTDAGYVRLNRDIATGYSFYGYTPGRTSYEFCAWKECGDVLGAFFGHQHVEGISGVWDGVELGFTYGCQMAKTGPYGFRVFTVREDDPANYENTLYRYEGKVKLNTVKITEEPVTAYASTEGPLGVFVRLRNLLLAFFSAIVSLF